MQVRQVYVDLDTRTRVAYGSAGTNIEKHSIKLWFDATTVNEDCKYITDKYSDDAFNTSKSIMFQLSYNAQTDRYEANDDVNTYATLVYDSDEKLSTINLCHKLTDNTYVITSYQVDGDSIITASQDVPEIIVNDVLYTAKKDGKFYEYHTAKFVNDEGKVSTKEDRCTHAKGAEAIRQYLLQHLSILKHELWYNYEYGLPLMDGGLTKAMVDAEVVTVIFECPGIESIISFESAVNKEHEYHLLYEVQTVYGKLEMLDTLQ